ncbi:MAG: HAMP domain-containing sensor histidine kinase [Syntrophomonadaceae bacterium]
MSKPSGATGTALKINYKGITGKLLLSYLLVVICSTAITTLSFRSILYDDLEKRTRDSLSRQAFAIAFALSHEKDPAKSYSQANKPYVFFSYHSIESQYLILDSEETVLYSSLPNNFPSGKKLSELPASQNLKFVSKDGKAAHHGADLLAVRVPIGAPEENLGSVIAFAEVTALEALNQAILLLLLKSTLIALIIALPLALILGRYIVKPLKSLQDYARAIARRRFDVRLDLKSDDELADLANTFNDMAYQLERYDTSMRRFFQSTSHEIKTPLMSIQGFAEGIRDGVFSGPQADHALETISRECQRLKVLLDEMINLTRQESPVESRYLESCDIGSIMREAVEAMQGYAVEKKVQVTLDIPDELQVIGDPEKQRRLFGNLLNNAIRHANSQVSIHGHRAPGSRSGIQISIQDDGKGFSDQDLEHAFDYLYKGVDGSTGLGLSIARLIVDELNGTISLRNAEKGGGLVEIVFPY